MIPQGLSILIRCKISFTEVELKAEFAFCLSLQKQEQGGGEGKSSPDPGPAGEGRECLSTGSFSTDTGAAADQFHLLSGTLAKAAFSLCMSIPGENHPAKYGVVYLRASPGSVSSCSPANG